MRGGWISWALVGLLVVAVLVLSRWFSGQGSAKAEVVLYAAQDRVYAEPIVREFEQATGIRVRALYDSEAVKTVGLANRLLAEKAHPQCDVFWGNEELRTRQLAARGVFLDKKSSPYGWAAFGYRSRRMAMAASPTGTNVPVPQSLLDLTNAVYFRRVALAYPLFGTTGTHLLALRQHWGEAGWLAWCRALAANQPFIVDGNSVSVKFVERGEAWVALTDSDDIAAANREGASLRALPISRETLLIPNTVALVQNSSAGRKLFEYLQSSTVIQKLTAAGALEGTDPPMDWPATLQPDWAELLQQLEPATQQMKDLFRK